MTGSNDRSIRLWDLETGAELEALHGQGVKVDAVAVDPTGRWLASNGQHHEVSIWDLERSEVTTRLEGHSARVDGVDFSPDGSLLASGSWDGTVRLWELDSLSELRVLQGHERAVPFVAFSPKGDALTSVSWDGTVRWWDAATGDGRIVGHDPGRLYGVAFTQDGQSIVAASSDYHARLWPVEGGEPRVIAEHANEVNAIATSPQGELAVTGSDDTTVRLWRVADGTPFWHAPLLLTDPPRLLSHRGLERLSANPQEPRATTREVLPTWLADAAKRAKLGSASAQGDLVCMLTVDRELLTWRASSGERLSTRTLPDALEVLASPGGCLVREAKRAVHMPEAGGGSRVLVAEAEVRALGWAMGRALIATASEVIQVDSKGELVSSSPTTPGTSAVTLVKLDRQEAPALVVGYRDGGVELRRDDNNVPFERTSTSAVVRLLGGPAGTIVVGHADGALGLHDAANGQGIARAHLHGRVAHLLLTQDANASALYAASDLGSWLRWDLRVFSSDRCTFLRAVWRDVPVVWRSGSVQASEAPADHPCRTTTE